MEEVCDALHRDGLCEKKDVVDLYDRSFCRDVLCPDTLVFSQQLRPRLQDSSLTGEHVLNIQVESYTLKNLCSTSHCEVLITNNYKLIWSLSQFRTGVYAWQ